jgi:hypothetical protein
MSKHNTANKNHYVMGGRLSQDDIARERVHQAEISGRSKQKENVTGRMRKSGEPAANHPRNAREE